MVATPHWVCQVDPATTPCTVKLGVPPPELKVFTVEVRIPA